MKTSFTILFLLVYVAAFTQAEANFLNRDYQFRDGLYLSLASFQSDTPDWPLDTLEGRLVTNDDTGLTKSDFLAVKSDTGAMDIDLHNVWGICLDGHPYIRIQEIEEEEGFATFAILKVRGAICYFTFESEEYKYVEVKAYNPLNGKPFRRGRVKNKVVVTNKRMLRFDTGEVASLNRENLLDWVENDPQVSEAISSLKEADPSEKLYRSILVYDDRHPVFINRKD